MKPSLTIREFRYPEDYQAVIDLWANAGPGIHLAKSDAEPEIKKKLQRDPDLFLVMEEEDKIIGAVLGGYDGRRGMVYHLAVTPKYQHHGIGKALMQALEDRLRRKGCLKAYLLVTKDNDAANFYESIGWGEMDLLIFGKELA